MQYRSCLSVLWGALGLLCASSSCRAQYISTAPDGYMASIASDGSVDVNTQWEAGQSTKWYIELQGKWADYCILDGIAREDETTIDTGLRVLGWGLARQRASDGSFPGTADAFHSINIFVVFAAQGLLALKNYHPLTYTYNAGKYASTISADGAQVVKAAHWLIVPANLQKGMQQDAPYTHRRYLLGAALAYAAQLTGDTSLSDAAVPHIQEGLGLQLTSGWRAALTRNGDGTYPPAVLVKPGDPTPAGATQIWDAVGVNPEENGYDISYQCVSTLFAEDYCLTTANTNLQASLRAMVAASLSWEAAHVATGGVPDTSGSSRTGQGHERDGTLKAPDLPEMIAALRQGASLCNDPRYGVVGTRLDAARYPVAGGAVVASDGAAGANADWEAGTAPTFAIARQAVGADWVQAGVDRNDPALISTGLQILDWGWARQAADGSFPGTDDPFDGTARFVEASARAALLLKYYAPILYSLDPATYQSVLTRYKSNLTRATGWLVRSDIANAGQAADAPYTSRAYLLAAALGETGVFLRTSAPTEAAKSYLRIAVPRQASDGTNPENGAFDVNAQADGVLSADRYYRAQFLHSYAQDKTLMSQIKHMASAALRREAKNVTPQGVVSGANAPDYATMEAAFAQGSLVTVDARMTVYAARVHAHP